MQSTPSGPLHNFVIPTKVGIHEEWQYSCQSEPTSLNPLVFPLGHQGGGLCKPPLCYSSSPQRMPFFRVYEQWDFEGP